MEHDLSESVALKGPEHIFGGITDSFTEGSAGV
jgi:hypothetical protein